MRVMLNAFFKEKSHLDKCIAKDRLVTRICINIHNNINNILLILFSNTVKPLQKEKSFLIELVGIQLYFSTKICYS